MGSHRFPIGPNARPKPKPKESHERPREPDGHPQEPAGCSNGFNDVLMGADACPKEPFLTCTGSA
eukprot:1138604-Pyramimonas_sp.AAC.1